MNNTTGEVARGRADELKKHQRALAQINRDAAKIAGAPATAEQPARQHSAEQTKTIRHTYANKENARRAARSEYLKLSRTMASFSITLARGRPDLLPDAPAQVRGFKPTIDETAWIISRVTHNVTDAGYTTAVEMELAY